MYFLRFKKIILITSKINIQDLRNSVTDFEQRIFIKFGVLLEKNAAVIERNLKEAIVESAYKYRTVANWVQKYSMGRVDTNDHKGSARNIHPESEEGINLIREKLFHNKGYSVRQLALETGIPATCVYEIFTEMKCQQ